jgi:hypothetical protein
MNDPANSLIMQFLDSMAEGQVARVTIQGDHLALTIIPLSDLRDFLADERYIGALCLLERCGLAAFQRILELDYFPPRSPREPFLISLFIRWKGILWTITSIPRAWMDDDGRVRQGQDVIRDVADQGGLRVVNDGFTPAIIEPGGSALDDASRPVGDPQFFAVGAVEFDLPMRNLVLLENKIGHLVYTDPHSAFAREMEQIEAIEAKHGRTDHGG